MKIKKIIYTPQFEKSWKKLPIKLKKKAVRQEKLFRQNFFHSSLLTHKLKGKLKKYWSFSLDYHTRIIFRFLKKSEVLFVDVGTHEVYR
jgi:mRNA-degrading endonuclease YafQ of YafQ-DinJ toxin-antitoxin module